MPMFAVLQVVTVMLVALAAALSVAHALELPGKMRLDRETYLATQRIYYPGFTIGGGVGDGGGLLATLALLIATPFGTTQFWLVLVAFVGLLGMTAVYWLVTHPVNKYWLKGQELGGFGARFFQLGGEKQGNAPHWRKLRATWEYSHVARAVLTSISLLALVVSLVVGT